MLHRLILFFVVVSTSSFARGRSCKLIFEVNKTKREITTSDTLTLYRGDLVKLIKTSHCGSDMVFEFVGLKRDTENQPPVNDLNNLIDTAYAFSDGIYAQGKFQIFMRNSAAELKSQIQGTLSEPELHYAVLTTSGSERIVRNGDVIELMAKQKLKVSRVETNLTEKKLINVEFKNTGHSNRVQLFVKYQNFKFATIETRIR